MIFLQAANSPMTSNLVFLLAIMLVMYFFFMRPQMKRQKEQMSFESAIKKGDTVVTSSGIIGKVSKVEGAITHIQVDQKTFIKVLSSAINKEMSEKYNTAGTSTDKDA